MAAKRARKEEFKAKLTDTIQTVLDELEPEEVTKIVEYLMSASVGATSFRDLEDATAAIFPTDILAPIKVPRLLRCFKSAPGGSAGSVIEAPAQAPATQSFRRPSIPSTSEGGYEFNIPWSSLPKETLDELARNELEKKRAKQGDIDKLKLAIVKKLVSSYNTFKAGNPGQKKHPGIQVYRSITHQVFERYPFALADSINNRIVGDGKATFQRAVLVSTENMMRQKSSQSPRASAVRGTGIVGVSADEYQPHLSAVSREEQEEMRGELQMMYEEDMRNWKWDEIKVKMLASFELQRDDIVSARNLIEEQRNAISDGNDPNPDDPEVEPGEKALPQLWGLWPLLFQVTPLTWHHDRLTKRDLQAHMKEFLDKHLKYAVEYMTSCSKANKTNLVLSLKLDKRVPTWSDDKILLKFIMMLANHFGENYNKFLNAVEKTTPLADIDLKGQADICIIAHDSQLFADEYYICADEEVLLKCTKFQQAITSLVQLTFVLDLEYPKLPLTFEFLERFVYGMGLTDTRIKKKGKTILVITPGVRDLINGLLNFQKELEEDSE